VSCYYYIANEREDKRMRQGCWSCRQLPQNHNNRRPASYDKSIASQQLTLSHSSHSSSSIQILGRQNHHSDDVCMAASEEILY
jgi:hypothetical protein